MLDESLEKQGNPSILVVSGNRVYIFRICKVLDIKSIIPTALNPPAFLESQWSIIRKEGEQ